MAYVINLGRSGIELVGINKNVVRSYNRYDFRQPDDLESEEDFKSLLDELKSASVLMKGSRLAIENKLGSVGIPLLYPKTLDPLFNKTLVIQVPLKPV